MWFTDAAKGGQLSEAATKPQGESADKFFSTKGAFEVRSVSFDAEMPQTVSSGQSGAGAGKVKFGSIKITRDCDLASAPLFTALCAGAHFPTLMLACRKAGGQQLIHVQYIFRMVFVTKIDYSGGGGEANPTENIEFVYGAMGIQYARQKPTGDADTPITAAWSVINNKPTLEVAGLSGSPTYLAPGAS